MWLLRWTTDLMPNIIHIFTCLAGLCCESSPQTDLAQLLLSAPQQLSVSLPAAVEKKPHKKLVAIDLNLVNFALIHINNVMVKAGRPLCCRTV